MHITNHIHTRAKNIIVSLVTCCVKFAVFIFCVISMSLYSFQNGLDGALKAAEALKEQRAERHLELQKRICSVELQSPNRGAFTPTTNHARGMIIYYSARFSPECSCF